MVLHADATPMPRTFDIPGSTKAESRSAAEHAKNLGNEHFKVNEMQMALHQYTAAVQCAEVAGDAELTAKVRANRAAAYNKMQMWQDAELDCTEALKLQPGFDKAVMRRAKARLKLKDFRGALEDAECVLAAVRCFALLHVKNLHPCSIRLSSRLRFLRPRSIHVRSTQL